MTTQTKDRIAELEAELAGARFAAQQHLQTVEAQAAIIARYSQPILSAVVASEAQFIELLIDACNAAFDCGEWREDEDSDCNDPTLKELVERSKEKKDAVIAAFRAALAAAPAQPTEQNGAPNFERMFMAACEDLGAINEALGLDPDDGGAEPIIAAIDALKTERDQWVDAGYAAPAQPVAAIPEAPPATVYEADDGTVAARHNGELMWHSHIYANAEGLDEVEVAKLVATILNAAIPEAGQGVPELTDADIDLIAKAHSKTLSGWEWSGDIIEVNGSDEHNFARDIEAQVLATMSADAQSKGEQA